MNYRTIVPIGVMLLFVFAMGTSLSFAQTIGVTYYTGYTNGGYNGGSFFRSITPVNAQYGDGTTLSETYGSGTVSMILNQGSNSYDLGFYYDAGTLGDLASSGLTIIGVGNYGVNLWLNPQDWDWNGNIYSNQGTDGAYGLGAISSEQLVNGTSSFYITAQGTDLTGCSGNTYTVDQLMSGACSMSASTPVYIWVGVGPGTSSASVPVSSAPTLSVSGSSSVNVGDTITLTASATGTTLSSYQWYNDTTGTPKQIPDATSSSFAETAGAVGTYSYYFVGTDSSGATGNSSTASVTVNPSVSLTPSTASATADQGGTVSGSSTLSTTSSTTGTTILSLTSGGNPVDFGTVFSSFDLSTNGAGPYDMIELGDGSVSSFQYGPPGYSITAGTPQVTTLSADVESAAPTGTYTLTTAVTVPSQGTITGTYTLTVNPALTVTATPSSPVTIDLGQSTQTIFANPSGGTPGYIYLPITYTGSCPGLSADGEGYPYTPTGTTSNCVITVYVSDQAGATASASTGTITVLADPTVSIPTTPLTYNVGQTASSITAAVTYSGTNSAPVEWYSSSTSSCSSSSTDTGISGTSFTPSTGSPGTTYYCAVVSDSGVPGYTSASSAVEVTVNTLPVPLTLSQSTIDAGQSLTGTISGLAVISPFNSVAISINGGTPTLITPATNLLEASDLNLGNGLTLISCPFSSATFISGALDSVQCGVSAATAGTYEVSVSFYSSLEGTGTPLATATGNLAVNSDPSLTSISPVTLDSGQQTTFTVTPSGGTGPLAYTWTLGTGLTAVGGTCGASDTTCTVSGTNTGSSAIAPQVSVYATDTGVTPNVNSNTASATVTVYPALVAGSIGPGAPTINYDQNVVLTAYPSGGTGTYSYQWYTDAGLGSCLDSSIAAISGATSSTYTAAPASGSTYYCYIVTDTASTPTSAYSGTDQVRVAATLAALTSTSSAGDAGQSVTFTGTINGGTTPFSVSSASGSIDGSLSSTLCSISSSTVTCGFTLPSVSSTQTETYTVAISDAGGSLTSNTSSITVNPDPSITSLTSAATVDVGQPATLTATATGGTVSTYTWTVPSGLTAGTDCISGTSTCTITGETPSPSNTPYTVTLAYGDSYSLLTTTSLVTVDEALSLSANDVANVVVDVPPGNTVTLNYTPAGALLSIFSANGVTADVLISNDSGNFTGTGTPSASSTSFSIVSILNLSLSNTPGVTYGITISIPCGSNAAPYIYNSTTGSWTPINITSSTSCTITFNVPADPVIGTFTSAYTPGPGSGGIVSGGGGVPPTTVTTTPTTTVATTTIAPAPPPQAPPSNTTKNVTPQVTPSVTNVTNTTAISAPPVTTPPPQSSLGYVEIAAVIVVAIAIIATIAGLASRHKKTVAMQAPKAKGTRRR